jgi:hypothetical protein
MRIIKNKTFLTICVFILTIQFISVALAKKPENPPPRPYSVKYGYAILEDGNGNVITSDGHDQYVDIEKVTSSDTIYWEGDTKRGDKIRVLSYDDNGELIWLRAFIGKPEMLEGSTGYRSPRRVNFNFDLYGDATTRPGKGMAVYDILSKITPDGPDRNLTGTVHFVVAIGSCDFFGEGAQTRAMFMVDPGCKAVWPGTDVISQTSVNAFDGEDGDPSYWTAIQGASTTDGDYDAHDQIAYHLLVNQLDVTVSHTTGGVADAWEITPKPGTVTLQVYKDIGRRNPKYVAVPLATYSSIPFKIILSLNPPSGAPPKEKTSTTLWGEIKSQE